MKNEICIANLLNVLTLLNLSANIGLQGTQGQRFKTIRSPLFC